VAEHLVRDAGLGEVDLEEILLGRLDALADGLGNFLGLARATSAAKDMFLPPLTTFVTRLMETTSSLRFSRFASIFFFVIAIMS